MTAPTRLPVRGVEATRKGRREDWTARPHQPPSAGYAAVLNDTGLGRPYTLAALALGFGVALAGLLVWLEPFSADQRSVLSVALATAAAATSVPTGLLLLSHQRVGGTRTDLDSGLIVLLLGLGWLLPARIAPMLSPDGHVLGIYAGVATSLAVLALARSTQRSRKRGDDMAASGRVRACGLGAIGFAAISLVDLLTDSDIVEVFGPVQSVFFALAAGTILLEGYRAERWSLTFIGMQLLSVQLGEMLSLRSQDVTSGGWLGACLLAFVGACIGTTGVLAVSQSASEQARQELVRSSINEVRMLQHQAMAEDKLHDLRSGLLSVEAFAGSLPLDGSTDLLVAELARLRAIVSAEREEVEIVDVTSGIHQLVAARASVGAPISSRVDYGIGAYGERSAVLQVVQNLIDNSLRHAPGKDVEVRAELDGDWALITVLDRGPGFDASTIEQVFDRGFSTNGSGLGLHIVRQTVDDLGGQVTIMNRPTGGARAEVRLPGRLMVEPVETGALDD